MGVCVAMQRPPQVMVGVQNELAGQGNPPTTQGSIGPGVGTVLMGGAVAIQAPPQNPVDGQVIVGVHFAPVGHGDCWPTVQAVGRVEVGEAIQRPPHVSVCVQIEPVGQGAPPNTQAVVHRGPDVVERVLPYPARTHGSMGRKLISFILTISSFVSNMVILIDCCSYRNHTQEDEA